MKRRNIAKHITRRGSYLYFLKTGVQIEVLSMKMKLSRELLIIIIIKEKKWGRISRKFENICRSNLMKLKAVKR